MNLWSTSTKNLNLIKLCWSFQEASKSAEWLLWSEELNKSATVWSPRWKPRMLNRRMKMANREKYWNSMSNWLKKFEWLSCIQNHSYINSTQIIPTFLHFSSIYVQKSVICTRGSILDVNGHRSNIKGN